MKRVIEAYIRPADDRRLFFRAYLLNNSVVALSAKLKLIFAINNELSLVKIDRHSFHRLLAIRNAFAHNDIGSGFRVGVPEDPQSSVSEHIVMESIKSDGSTEIITRAEALREFESVLTNVQEALRTMLEKLRG